MPYTPNHADPSGRSAWKNGDKVTPKDLNHIENGIVDVSVKTDLIPTPTPFDAGDVITVDEHGIYRLSPSQSPLEAGENITIEDNVISATDTTYTAGDGITIDENNVISAVAGTAYTAGNGLTLDDGEFAIDETIVATKTDLQSKQDTLVDTGINANIKTINGQSILGAGNIAVRTYQAFNQSWDTNHTVDDFCASVNADSSAVEGMAYLGGVRFSDFPSRDLSNADLVVEIITGSGTANKVIHLTLTSGDIEPYRWEYTYWNNGIAKSGWVSWQRPISAGTGISLNGTEVSVDTTTIATKTDLEPIEAEIQTKQDILIPGNNITIEDNEISATDTTYSAGTNIEIDENNVISVVGELGTDDYNDLKNIPIENADEEPAEPAINNWYKINDNIYKYRDLSSYEPFSTDDEIIAGNKIHFDITKGKELEDAVLSIYNQGLSYNLLVSQADSRAFAMPFMVDDDSSSSSSDDGEQTSKKQNVYIAILEIEHNSNELILTPVYATRAGTKDGLVFEQDGFQTNKLDHDNNYIISESAGKILLIEEDPEAPWNGTIISKTVTKKIYDRVAFKSEVDEKLSYTTKVPTEDNLDGIIVAVLNENPPKKYKGYIYVIDGADPSEIVGNSLVLGEDSYIEDHSIMLEEECAIDNHNIILE